MCKNTIQTFGSNVVLVTNDNGKLKFDKQLVAGNWVNSWRIGCVTSVTESKLTKAEKAVLFAEMQEIVVACNACSRISEVWGVLSKYETMFARKDQFNRMGLLFYPTMEKLIDMVERAAEDRKKRAA